MLKWILTLILGVSGLSKLDQLVLQSRQPIKINKIKLSTTNHDISNAQIEIIENTITAMEAEKSFLELDASDSEKTESLFEPAIKLANLPEDKIPKTQERDWKELIEKTDVIKTTQSGVLSSVDNEDVEDMVIYEYAKEEKRFDPVKLAQTLPPSETVDSVETNGFLDDESQDVIKLFAFGVNEKGLIGKNISEFDLSFIDSDERYFDHGTGYISLTDSKNRKFYLYHPDYVRTVSQLNSFDSVEQYIPLFANKYFKKLAGSHYKEQASLLIKLDDETEDVFVIANNKAKKHYLNSQLKIVDRQTDEYEYVLFTGLNSGNHVINYMRIDSTYIQKIAYLGVSEITYEDNSYRHQSIDKFRLVEQNLMGRKMIELNIRNSEIKLFSSNVLPRKEGLNNYIYEDLFTPSGVRKYYELTHLTFNLYMGREDHSKVEIPDEQYVSEVMRSFNVDKLDGRCLIQFNLTKQLKDYKLNAMNNGHSMYTEELLLGSDGIFYDLVLENTVKLFVMGDKPGVMNLKFEFLDNSNQYIESFCSADAYLVEQL
jgi:hypothetical protein